MSVISSALVPAERAKLQANVNSVGSASPFPVKTATVANTTNNRSEISAQTSKLLGDSRVPPPDFSGDTASIQAQSESTQARTAKSLAAFDKFNTTVLNNNILRKQSLDEIASQKKIVDAASAKYREAKNTLPEGDPELVNLKAAANVEITKYNKLLQIRLEKLDQLANEESVAKAAWLDI